MTLRTRRRHRARRRRYRLRWKGPGCLLVVAVVVCGLLGTALVWSLHSGGRPTSSGQTGTAWFRLPWTGPKTTGPDKVPAPPVSIYTGREVSPEVYRRRPLAAMIDNLAAARPQSGLDKADMVYEVLAEGGITRFFALFQGDADVVGPVRSVRHYFLDLVMEHEAILVHCGQSPQAEADIPALKINNINELSGTQGKYFWRSKDRQAPHNLYTSTAQLRQAAAQSGYAANLSAATPAPIFRRGTMPASAAAATDITIKYPDSYLHYQVQYQYANGVYLRFSEGKPHAAAPGGKQLTADSVLVQYVPAKPIPNDPALRIDVFFVGQGKATLFAGGKTVEATWKKESRSARTEFYDAEGKRLTVPPGRTWVMVVPPETSVIAK